MSDDDDGGIVWDRVRTALVDEDGIRWRRAARAVRSEVGLDDAGLFGLMVGLSSYAFVFAEGTSTDPVLGGLMVAGVTVFLAGMMIARSISDYYAHDEEVAIKELRKRYAADEITFAEFQRLVDRIIAGEEVEVFEGDGSEDGGESDADPAPPVDPDADPVEILRTRYARGEIDDGEFERRLRRLQETGAGEDGDESESDRAGFELER